MTDKLKLRAEYVKDLKSLSIQLGKSLKTEMLLRDLYKKSSSDSLLDQIKISINFQKKIEKQINTSITLYGSTFGYEEANKKAY